MSRRISFAITTAVVLVVAIIALTAIALWGPDDSRAEMLTGGGLFAAVILASMRELFSLNDRDSNSGPRGGALLLIGVVLASAAPAMACSPTQWEAHAYTAQGFREVANTAGEIIREARMDHMRAAAREAEASGGDVEAAIDASAAEWDRQHRLLIQAQRAFAALSTRYSSGAYAALRGRPEDPAAVNEDGRRAGAQYAVMLDALRRANLREPPAPLDGALEFVGADTAGGEAAERGASR